MWVNGCYGNCENMVARVTVVAGECFAAAYVEIRVRLCLRNLVELSA